MSQCCCSYKKIKIHISNPLMIFVTNKCILSFAPKGLLLGSKSQYPPLHLPFHAYLDGIRASSFHLMMSEAFFYPMEVVIDCRSLSYRFCSLAAVISREIHATLLDMELIYPVYFRWCNSNITFSRSSYSYPRSGILIF